MDLEELFGGGRVLLIAAHPDDETAGAGAQLRKFGGRVTIAHATDGAPRDMVDAERAGFTTREAYAETRRMELMNALAYAGIGPSQCRELGRVDQEASFDLAGLSRDVAALLGELRPGVVLTHPYEGGHPDHDACAFAVHCAAAVDGGRAAIVEFTSYHAGRSGLATGEFLPGAVEIPAVVYELGMEERRIKRRMMEAFLTQRTTLGLFGVDQERFRRAPRYDFTQPPHDGPLLYENFEWGMAGARWRELAAEALKSLGLPSPS
jgi:N-acetylglucosamine malate deacetylase 2